MKNYRNFLLVLSTIYHRASESKPISNSEIIQIFSEEYGLEINYRTIGTIVDSFNENQSDYEITILKSNTIKYYFSITPSLEFGEAKAIVDLVYSSKFFSHTVKDNFIKRMKEELLPKDRNQLDKQLDTHIHGNENDQSFFNSFETISTAIYSKHKISFNYIKPLFNEQTIKEYTSMWPIETYCANNTFYVYCFDELETKLKSFRIDFIKKVKHLDSYESNEEMNKEVTQKIIESTYGYSSSRKAKLELTFKKDLYSNMIDKFGKSLPQCTVNKDHYTIELDCPISSTFYSWIIGFGGDIQITGPNEEVEAFKEFLKERFL